MQKELAEAGDQGYGFVGMTVAKTLVGGDEVGLLRTLVVHSDEPRAIESRPPTSRKSCGIFPFLAVSGHGDP